MRKSENDKAEAGLRRKLAQGVAAVAILVSATAVMNTLARVFEMPLNSWLDAAVSAYQALFYPIIDATLGRIVTWIGLIFPEDLRDYVILYSIGYSAYFRMRYSILRKGSAQEKRNAIRVRVAIRSIFWPIPAFFVVLALNQGLGWIPILEASRRGEPWAVRLEEGILKFERELFYVFIVVVVAVLFNASGILE